MSVVIVVPVLGRPHRVRGVIDNVAATTPHPYRLLFVASESDKDEQTALRLTQADYIVTPDSRRTYPCKINDGIRASVEPLIFTGADDLKFYPGWLTAATSRLSSSCDVVGTNDLGNRYTMGEMAWIHSTHTLIRRSYIDDIGGVIDQPPGIAFNEQYPHDYSDNELVHTAQHRGVYDHALDAHVEHLHPVWKKADDDPTYQLGRSTVEVGRAIYYSRRHLWTHWTHP